MIEAPALPTRRAEEWRYADLDALAAFWPLPEAEQVTVAAGAGFSRAIVREEAGVTRLVLRLEAGARASIHVLNAAGGYGRIELDVTLQRGADFTLGAVQLGGDTQTLEIVSTVRHVEPDATSRQIVRSVLSGHATGTCLGKVAVSRGAVGTDAEQSVRAMLLDRTAQANAKPELEIFADDVKCAHGCAVGELDAQGLFYLESRGLTPPQAKRLMLQAFIAEAFAHAPDADDLQQRALERLGALV